MPELAIQVAMNIRRAREMAGLTQEAAAAAAGLSRAAYRSLESGQSQPRDRTLLSLARALHVRPEDLLRPPAALPRARFRSLKRLNDRTGLLLAVGRQLQDYADLDDSSTWLPDPVRAPRAGTTRVRAIAPHPGR